WLQSADDLRLVADRHPFLYFTFFELRWRTTDENHVFAFQLLQCACSHSDGLFAELGRKLDIGEHIRLETHVMIGYFATNPSRSCLRIEHVTDVSHVSFKGLS